MVRPKKVGELKDVECRFYVTKSEKEEIEKYLKQDRRDFAAFAREVIFKAIKDAENVNTNITSRDE